MIISARHEPRSRISCESAIQRLKDQPGLQPLRIELMKAAIDRYEPFLAKPIADPTPREELARLHAQYGLLLQESSNGYEAAGPPSRRSLRRLGPFRSNCFRSIRRSSAAVRSGLDAEPGGMVDARMRAPSAERGGAASHCHVPAIGRRGPGRSLCPR